MTTLEPFIIDPKTFLREHYSLPALPEILNEIRDIMFSKDVSVGKLANLISKDVTMVAQILKIVNSAYYSLPIEISEVRYAVAYLGMNEIHRIILSLSVINTLTVEEKPKFDNIWFHSLLTALCTKYIAQKSEPKLNLNELWSAALLHDIGKFVYLKFFPEHFKLLLKFCKENSCLFSEAETHFSFPKSSYLGTLLCDRWRLPIKIADACSFHSLADLRRNNEHKDFTPHTKVVIIGNLIAELTHAELNKKTKEDIIKNIKQCLNIEQEEFHAMMVETVDLKEMARNLLHVLNSTNL